MSRFLRDPVDIFLSEAGYRLNLDDISCALHDTRKMPKDYYKILGVDKNTKEDDIKKAFRRLAHEHHPDKGGDAKRFKDINEAYQVLGDKQKRATYDQFGSAAFENGGMGASGPGGAGVDFSGFNINMDDFGDLGDMLGGVFGFGGRGSRQKRGHDLEAEVQIEFLESVFGVDKEIRIYRHQACSLCHGNGADPSAGVSTCKTCGGSGRIQQAQRTLLGTLNTVVACPDCHGTGQRVEKPCKQCSGTGVEKKETSIGIKIPPGIENGEALKVSAQGEYPGPGGRTGDLYIRVRVRSHAEFSRSELNILSTVYVPFTVMVLGGNYDVNTVDGQVALKIPAGTVAGTVFKLREKGVPSLHGRGRGDHLIALLPQVPKKLTKEQKKLLDELQGQGL